MNLQGTFLGMLGTVSAVTALNRQADIEAANFKQQQAEKQFNINEDIIKKESSEVAVRLGIDPNKEREQELLKKKGYSNELIDNIMKQTEYEQNKDKPDSYRTLVEGGMTSPEVDRRIKFAQETYARQEELHNTLTKLKKGYGGIR